MRFSIIPFLLLGIPLAEIAVFVLVGQQIGVLPTLGLVLGTTILGFILLRVQGFGVFSRMQNELAEHRLPGRELVHGVMIFAAGLLLALPGFVTDFLGLLLFVPPIRDIAWRFVRRRVIVVTPDNMKDGSSYERQSPKTIDLETGDYSSSDSKDSPWRPK